MPRIVAVGGGTGLPAVLEGLRAEADAEGDMRSDHISAVVTVTDDGGSSGWLRREFGVLPPGDVRNCLAAIAPPDSPFKQLLQHRFEDGDGLEGHAVGNLMLTALAQITGNFPAAVEQLGTMMGLRGRVLPTTGENVRLRAELECGTIVEGETEIVGTGSRIKRLALTPSPKPLPEVLRALINADGIIIGPGSLYTSVLPNLLVEGVAATISGVDAVRIYVANLMTEPGETDGYSLDDHLHAIRVHARHDLFDYIVVNRRPIPSSIAGRYALQGSRPVVVDRPLKWAGRARVIECDLACECDGKKIRHAARPLAQTIRALVAAGRPAH
ncbi:MAG: gluconeogenesis factor YvcK family protein [Vicinamibacterales bacterium]